MIKNKMNNGMKYGDIATKDIIVDNKILVKKGTEITKEIAQKLEKIYMEESIFSEGILEGELIECNVEKENFIQKLYKEDKNELIRENKVLETTEKNIKDYTKKLNNLFEELEIVTKKGSINEVTVFCKKIIEEMKSQRALIKGILLNGSGKDVIFRHSVNVTVLSLLLGKWCGYSDTNVVLLMRTAMLHDYGKYKVDENILLKKERLSKNEIDNIKNHPIIGYNLVKNVPYLKEDVKLGILMHHERMDGSGYPLGIKGNKIHSFAKIIAIADVFDALNSDREHKKRKDPFTALKIIQEESLLKLDYEIAQIFINNMINYYIGEYVRLSDGKIAKVIQMDVHNITKPLIICDDGFKDLKKEKDLKIINMISYHD
ncbi:MAG: HD-GYP domain-containing protein [Clostridium sp.]